LTASTQKWHYTHFERYLPIMAHLFLYGPPGSGKSTLGKILSERLERKLVDVDHLIEANARMIIPDIIAAEGEAGFRLREQRALKEAAADVEPCIISLGGGALLNPENRAFAESKGTILFLDVSVSILEQRIANKPNQRPLLAVKTDCAQPPAPGKGKPIAQLLAERADHYASFPCRVVVGAGSPEETADCVQATLGLYRVSGMGKAYDVMVGADLIDPLGAYIENLDIGKKTVVVGDSHTIPLYGDRVIQALQKVGIAASAFTIPAGEATKTLATATTILNALAKAGLERDHTVFALGGGVVGDLTGFAASIWMRGIRWINLPTTLLAMVDAGIGGKTGADLPEGKNLVGAFHAPSAVFIDTSTLATLPVAELRCGLAETIKHAIIGDPGLIPLLERFACCKTAEPASPCNAAADAKGLVPLISRALAVKVKTIIKDPYEKDIRAALNLGHTIGHAIEHHTHFTMLHGEAVAIGTVIEARLAEKAGLAAPGFADQLAEVFASVGLPTTLPPGLTCGQLIETMLRDKKTANGKIRFSLPAALGDVRIHQVIDEAILRHI
jgi:shikimate kinase/3-dehydroquinate synthase